MIASFVATEHPVVTASRLQKRIEPISHLRSQVASHPFADPCGAPYPLLQESPRLVGFTKLDQHLREDVIRRQVLRRLRVCDAQMLGRLGQRLWRRVCLKQL